MTRNARALLPLLILSTLGLASACTPLFSASDPDAPQSSSADGAEASITASEEDFALDDAVLAIQLSGRVTPLYGEGSKGYLALVNEKGAARVRETGIMEYATPLWTEDGLYFGMPDHEGFIDGSGLHLQARRHQYHELDRYPHPHDGGYTTFYNQGGNGTDFIQYLVHGDSEGFTGVEAPGVFTNFGSCDGRFFMIGETSWAPSLRDEAIAHLSPDIVADEGAHYQFLAELLPSDPDEPVRVLASAPLDEQSFSGSKHIACRENQVYFPGFRRLEAHPTPEERDKRKQGSPAFIVWNLTDGTRSVVPWVDEAGVPISLRADDLTNPEFLQDGKTAYVVLFDGRGFVVDLDSAIARQAFTATNTGPDFWPQSFHLTRNYAYALDYGEDPGQVLELARYDWAKGRKESLLTIDSLGPHREESVVEGIAVNPSWLSTIED